MGRLINETDLINLLYALDDARHDLFYAIKKIPELPTVDAIPKDQYEARLKADLVAILTEIQLEIEEKAIRKQGIDSGFEYDYEFISSEEVIELIQQKIDKLKGK